MDLVRELESLSKVYKLEKAQFISKILRFFKEHQELDKLLMSIEKQRKSYE
jgi:hypothetical protein